MEKLPSGSPELMKYWIVSLKSERNKKEKKGKHFAVIYFSTRHLVFTYVFLAKDKQTNKRVFRSNINKGRGQIKLFS